MTKFSGLNGERELFLAYVVQNGYFKLRLNLSTSVFPDSVPRSD